MASPRRESPCRLAPLLVALVALAVSCNEPVDSGQDPEADPARASSSGVLERLGAGPGSALGHALRFRPALERFYKRRPATAAWSRAQAEALLAAIEAAPAHGLEPETYRKDAIATALANRGVKDLELDLLLSDAFLAYAAHLAFGRLAPATLEPDWRAERRDVDLVASLAKVTAGENLEAVLHSLSPRTPDYQALVGALERYRKMTWEPLATDLATSIKAGSPKPAITALTTRLVAEGFLASPGDELSDGVVDALRAFQRAHGLEETGEIGRRTALALGTTPADRVQQLELNLERWRWLPDDLGSRHLRVNIPSYTLTAYENDKPVLEMPVIVGKAYRRTPIFSGPITDVVLHPPWGVPRRLAVEDKLPLLRKDPTYLQRHNLSVYRGDKLVDPTTIDWSKHSKNNFPFRLRQAAGPGNPLGLFKFNLVNEFDVYLHDTNERALFAKTERSLSSGCIRLGAPMELATFVLGGAGWNASKLEAALATKQTKRITAPPPQVVVHLLYQTAWVDGAGAVHFRADLDGRDARLAAALKRGEALPATPRAPQKDRRTP